MFENALITRAGVDRHVDLGLVAETLFFYRSAHLLLNSGSIRALAQKIPADDLIALIDRTKTKLTYLQSNFGVVTAGAIRSHQFVAIRLGGTAERKVKDYRDEIALMLERALGKSATTTHLTNAILSRVALHKFKGVKGKENTITELARSDVSDNRFVHQAILAALKNLVPAYQPPTNFRFNVHDTGEGYAVDTNLDFFEVNKLYHENVPIEHSSIDAAYLLTHIQDARSDSYFAANYMADIVTTPVYSDIIKLKHFDFLRRREENDQEIQLFRDIALPNFPSIREAINSGERTISDFLNLLDASEKFKGWLADANPDEGLIQNYHRAATAQTWADKLPTKSVRFAIATGLGLLADVIAPTGLGTITGVSIGAADTFYADKLIKGWKPNQFIEGPYRDFVTGKNE